MNLYKMFIGPLSINGIVGVDPDEPSTDNSIGSASAKPMYSFGLRNCTSFLSSSVEFRSMAEALREVLQKKASSEWVLLKRGFKIFITHVSDKDSKDWCWLNIEIQDESENIPLSIWETRGLIRQLDHFADSLETDCLKVIKDKNITNARKALVAKK